MHSVEEAKKIIAQNTHLLPSHHAPLLQAQHKYLAADLYSPIDVPTFDNSAMDGYALQIKDVKNHEGLPISAEIAAGDTGIRHHLAGTATRIYTGAPVPIGADTVIPQEMCRVENAQLFIDKMVDVGANIRKKGSQTSKNSLVMRQGSEITAGAIGFLATLGLSELSVYQTPRVSVITTGSELVEIGKELKHGQIYNSNALALTALLNDIHITPTHTLHSTDNLELLQENIEKCLQNSDLVIISGGISVGDYDLVKPALENLGVEQLLYKVKQRPGKPMYVGKRGSQLIFALPGNPAAVFGCFHFYVKPTLMQMMGKKHTFAEFAILGNNFTKKQGLTFMMKGVKESMKVKILEKQQSYQMDAFAEANVLVILDEDRQEYLAGEEVRILEI
ncbi:MAG: molybdopterin molybdotransferase MoeA [Weeksellaceae bacterium]|nr:molybdopterin molybdotransferase MoeA [Weeksellaceae bacterium]